MRIEGVGVGVEACRVLSPPLPRFPAASSRASARSPWLPIVDLAWVLLKDSAASRAPLLLLEARLASLSEGVIEDGVYCGDRREDNRDDRAG
jgi:hypothetical protein